MSKFPVVKDLTDLTILDNFASSHGREWWNEEEKRWNPQVSSSPKEFS